MEPVASAKSGGNLRDLSEPHGVAALAQLKDVSLVEWIKFAFYVLVLSLGAGMWWQSQKAEGENLAGRIVAQGEIFSDRLNALSARINSLEAKQALVVSDVADTKVLIGTVRNEIASVGKDVSFLAQKIAERGDLQDRQLTSLQTGQAEINRSFNEKLEEVTGELAEHRVLLERSGLNAQGQRRDR